jgi:hypothetical protein
MGFSALPSSGTMANIRTAIDNNFTNAAMKPIVKPAGTNALTIVGIDSDTQILYKAEAGIDYLNDSTGIKPNTSVTLTDIILTGELSVSGNTTVGNIISENLEVTNEFKVSNGTDKIIDSIGGTLILNGDNINNASLFIDALGEITINKVTNFKGNVNFANYTDINFNDSNVVFNGNVLITGGNSSLTIDKALVSNNSLVINGTLSCKNSATFENQLTTFKGINSNYLVVGTTNGLYSPTIAYDKVSSNTVSGLDNTSQFRPVEVMSEVPAGSIIKKGHLVAII